MITFRVPSGELASLLQSISRVIPQSDPNRLRTEILFDISEDRLKLTGSNPQYRISGEIVLAEPCEPCLFTVPPSDINDYVKELPEQPLTFTYQPNEDSGRGPLKMSFAGGEINFTATNGENYPIFDPGEPSEGFSFEIETSLIRQGIAYTINSACNLPDRKNISCIYFRFRNDYLDIVGTDGLILSRYRVNNSFIDGLKDNDKKDFLLPYNCAHFMRSFLPRYDAEMMHVEVNEKRILFKIDSLEIESMLVDASYPNYESIIPTKFEYELSMDTTQLKNVVRRINKFINDDSFIDLIPTSEGLRIEAKKTEENKTANETISFENPNEMEMAMAFDKKRFYTLLENIETDLVLFNIVDITRPVIITPAEAKENTSLICLIAPIPVSRK